MRPIHPSVRPALAAACIACVAGCVAPPTSITDGWTAPPPVAPFPTTPATDGSPPLPLPRSRMGCLPFPGLLTLFAVADPAALGTHAYVRRPFNAGEQSRGILYTTRAGFLDVAHLRNTIDWTRYCVDRVRAAVAGRLTTLTFDGTNGSLVHLTLAYPPGFDALAPADRDRFLDELTLRTGEWLAYRLLVWHEAASWFGDHTFLFDESPSAFTWDDVTSHLVALRVADTAMRDPAWPFDQAVTYYLDAELRRVGAVGPPQTRAAVSAVEGMWWARGGPLKRQLDFEDATVRPWLVPGPEFADAAGPVAYGVPSLADVLGRDCRGFCRARIEPRNVAGERMYVALPPGAAPSPRDWLDADRDLPRVLDVMRQRMRERFGPDTDRP